MTTWQGIHKLTEECGELLQVLGKLGPFPSGNHPDGGDHLSLRLQEEMADVEAAIAYMREMAGLSAMEERRRIKLDKFRKWGLTGIDHGDQP